MASDFLTPSFFFFFKSPLTVGSFYDILTFEGVVEPLLVNPLIYKWWNLYLLPVALAFMLLLCCCLDRNQVLMPFCLNSKMAGCLVIHMLVLWWHLSKCALCILVHTLWEISIQPQTEWDVSNFLTGTLAQKQKEQRGKDTGRKRKRERERGRGENKFEANSTVTSNDRVRRVQYTAWLY